MEYEQVGGGEERTGTIEEFEMQPLNVGPNNVSEAKFGLLSDDMSNPIVYESVPSNSKSTGRRESFEDWLFPPHLPRSCQLLRPENIAVPLCYLLVGLLQGLSSPLINAFPLDLGATEAQQTTLNGIRSLPASFKLIFGFLSDNVPLFGYRRKPYMLIGWLTTSLSVFALIAFSNVNIAFENSSCFGKTDSVSDEMEKTDSSPLPDDAPSIAFLSICILGFGTGFWLADVMGDSIVAEKAKLEPEHSRGSVQSTCYSYRFFGMMVAAPLSTYLYSTVGPYYVILILSLLPLTILPMVFLLHEPRDAPVRSTSDQCGEIWNTVCSRAVWQPMGFVYLYNVMQVGNAAWREYLATTLHFSSCDRNLILICGLVLLYLGILAYKYYFITWSWRKVYIWTTCLGGFFSLLQVLLIYGFTFGISNFFFALGDDVFAEFIAGIQFLPTTIMMVHLCPTGSEGASYAMFTTVNNSALMLSSVFSTMLLRIWDVSKTALKEGRLQGMVNLTYLTTACQVGAIAFVGLLPKYKEDLVDLMKDSHRSEIGGFVFLAVTFSSVLYALVVGVLNIAYPGWMGES
jgi:MFS family permease